MKFQFDNNLPIYIQLVEQLKVHIFSGVLKPGERLPSVRELANISKVNPNTMQKALQELEELELIYTERTNGKFVTENIKIINKYRDKYALELANTFFCGMKNIGYEEKDAIKYLNELKGGK